MPESLSFNDANRVAGELFGNLLARDSDKEGFDYALKVLLSGEKSPRNLVRDFVISDEFRELHLMNQTPNEFARRLLTRFLGVKRLDPQRIKEVAVRILEGDWRQLMIETIDGPEYYNSHGEKNVPLWV